MCFIHPVVRYGVGGTLVLLLDRKVSGRRVSRVFFHSDLGAQQANKGWVLLN